MCIRRLRLTYRYRAFPVPKITYVFLVLYTKRCHAAIRDWTQQPSSQPALWLCWTGWVWNSAAKRPRQDEMEGAGPRSLAVIGSWRGISFPWSKLPDAGLPPPVVPQVAIVGRRHDGEERQHRHVTRTVVIICYGPRYADWSSAGTDLRFHDNAFNVLSRTSTCGRFTLFAEHWRQKGLMMMATLFPPSEVCSRWRKTVVSPHTLIL